MLKDVNTALFLLLTVFLSAFSSGNADFIFSGNNIISDEVINDILVNSSETAYDSILTLYANIGFPFAKIIIDSVYDAGDTRIAIMTIIEGKRQTVAGIRNKGNVSSGFIESVTGLKGMVFSESYIRNKLKLLYYYDFIDYMDWGIALLQVNEDSVLLIMEIDQISASSISGILTVELDSMKAEGYINADLISPFGYGRIYRLHYLRANNSMTSVNASAEVPYLFNTPLGLYAYAEYRNLDTLLTNTQISGGLTFSRGNLLLKSGLGRTWLFSIEEDQNEAFMSANAEAGLRSKYSKLTVRYVYGFRDNGYSRLTIAVNNEIVLNGFIEGLNVQGSIFFSDSNTNKYMMMPIGGTETVRGYAENFVYTYHNALINLYSGYRFSRNASAGLFADYALFTYNEQISDHSSIYSFGPYMRFRAGDIKLSIYYGLYDFNDILQGRVHISADLMF